MANKKKSSSKQPKKTVTAKAGSGFAMKLINLNPKNAPDAPTKNMKYVEVEETHNGKFYRKGLFLLSVDHIARLKK